MLCIALYCREGTDVEFGTEIVKRRKAHGWSRKYLMVECRRTGGDLLYSEIVRIEQGKVQPRTRTIVQIAAALGVQPYELLPVNGSKPAQAVSLLLSGCDDHTH